MHSSVLRGLRRGHRRRALGGLLLVAGIALAFTACSGPRYEKRGALHCLRDGATLYTFDSVWRTESLHRVDPATGFEDSEEELCRDPARAAAYRERLLRRLGVASLDAIPREGGAELKALRALGYL